VSCLKWFNNKVPQVKMLSVLIPIYNYKVTPLLSELILQLEDVNVLYEIICIDDASNTFYKENLIIETFKNVTLFKLESNIGRSKIRNLLAEKATYNWLLFLDSDVLPKKPNFIQNYVRCIKLNIKKVYVGGISYTNIRPKKDNLLRWVYGKKREEVSFSKRKNKPYNYFFGSNFLIHKSIFDVIKFNESIVKYGYEDFLFASSLFSNSTIIQHFDNPVIHKGINSTEDYLVNVKQSVENLYELNSIEILSTNNKILKIFKVLNQLKLTFVFSKFYTSLKKVFEYNLKSNYPSLIVLDVYKLTYLCYLENPS